MVEGRTICLVTVDCVAFDTVYRALSSYGYLCSKPQLKWKYVLIFETKQEITRQLLSLSKSTLTVLTRQAPNDQSQFSQSTLVISLHMA